MSLNIRKAKTINNLFTKLSKTKNLIQGHIYQSNLKKSHKDLTKKESVLDYLKSFLTQRKPFLLKENNILIKDRNNKNYLSTLPTQREIISPANLKSKGIFDLNTKIKHRNSFKINQINSMRYKNSSKIFFKNINYKNYSNKIRGFSPRNKYKLIKIYQSLHMFTPSSTKQPNLEKDFKNFENNGKNDDIINKEINIDSNNDKLKKNKTDKNMINIIKENKKENEIIFYKVQKVNSFQLVNKNRNNDIIINNNKYKLKEKYDSEENKLKERIVNDDTPKTYLEYLKIQKIKNVLKNNEPKTIYKQEKNNNDITFNVNNSKKEKNSKNKKIVEEKNNKSEYYIKNEESDINNKYNKINIMGNCLNKLFFDYSDGNYPNTTNYNYLKGDSQDKNIIINKEIIINQKMDNNIKRSKQSMPIQLKNELISSDFEKEEKIIAQNSPKKKEKINKSNRMLVPNQINRNNFIENKENINTENIKKPRNQVLYMDNEMQNNKINRSTIKNESNNKKNDEIIPDKNKSYLKEMNNINLNLDYLLENKNFVNIQLLSNIHKAKKNNPKKIIPPNNNFYKNSKVTKSPQSNLDFLLDRVPRHEKIFDDKNYIRSHSVKNSTINNEILRRNKIVEYISKNSSIMPPNDYNVSTHLISYY